MESDKRKVRLLLIDDHTLFRESLRRLLEAEGTFEIVGDFSTTRDALESLDRTLPDIVLLDFDLGEQNGLEFIHRCRSRNLTGQILLVTAGLSDQDTVCVLDLGASGIFLKHSPPAELLTAIRKVADGQPWLDPKSLRALLAPTNYLRRDLIPTTLNLRQKEVLRSVFEGLTNKEIGAKLGISETYVKSVIQQLFDITGVRSRSQLVRIVLEKKILYGY